MSSAMYEHRQASRRRWFRRTLSAVYHEEEGITLLEVGISFMVFAIGMLGILQMHVMASGSDGYARRVDTATQVARDLLHYLETVPFESALLQVHTVDANDGDPLDWNLSYNRATIAGDMFDFSDVDGDALPDALTTAPGSDDDPCSNDPSRSCVFRGFVHPDLVGADASGRPSLDYFGDGQADFERYWIVEELDDPEGGPSPGVRVIVIVRWAEPSVRGHRRVVMSTIRHDPSLMMGP